MKSTEQEINEAAKKSWETKTNHPIYKKNGINPYAYILGYKSGFNDAISQMQPEWEWNVIDFNDVDTFPLEFDRVLCLTVNDEYQVLHMLKYSDIHREWETSDLKRNESFCFEYVKQWKNINEPQTK